MGRARARTVSGTRMLLLAAAGLCAALPAAAQQSANEQAVWKLETDVLERREVGRPRGLSVAVAQGLRRLALLERAAREEGSHHRLDHRADRKGLHLQWYSIEPAASQATDNIVVTHYWVTAFWSDKAGHGDDPETSRITHTWLKTAAGWQIVGGMSVSPSRGK